MAAEVVSVVAAAAVPVFAALRWDVALSAIAGAVVLIATTVRTVLGFHDDWVEYVRLRFDLEREASAFLYRIEPYDTEDAEAQPASAARRRTKTAARERPVNLSGRRGRSPGCSGSTAWPRRPWRRPPGVPRR